MMLFPWARLAQTPPVLWAVRLYTATVYPLPRHVEDQVLSHHGQADEPDLCLHRFHLL